MVIVEFVFKGPNGMKNRIKEFNDHRHYKFYREKIPDIDSWGNKLVGERILQDYGKKQEFTFTVIESEIREVKIEANDFDSSLVLLKEHIKNNTTKKLIGETISIESSVKSFGKFEKPKKDKK